MKNTFAASCLLGLSTIALASCGSEPEQVTEVPEGIAGLEVENARMVLNAVSGNPAAVYFDLTYNGERAIQVRRVDVEGAESAMLHGYMEVDFKVQMVETTAIGLLSGETVKFEPGEQHVMAMNVSPELQPGDTAEVTVTIAGGDKHSFPAEVRGAGEER